MKVHALSQLGIRWKRGAVALAASAVLMLVLMLSVGAGTSQAWYCSSDGFRPWEHYSHSHSNGVDHIYESGHTHSWGDHHHVWSVYQYLSYVGQVHYNCGPA